MDGEWVENGWVLVEDRTEKGDPVQFPTLYLLPPSLAPVLHNPPHNLVTKQHYNYLFANLSCVFSHPPVLQSCNFFSFGGRRHAGQHWRHSQVPRSSSSAPSMLRLHVSEPSHSPKLTSPFGSLNSSFPHPTCTRSIRLLPHTVHVASEGNSNKSRQNGRGKHQTFTIKFD